MPYPTGTKFIGRSEDNKKHERYYILRHADTQTKNQIGKGYVPVVEFEDGENVGLAMWIVPDPNEYEIQLPCQQS